MRIPLGINTSIWSDRFQASDAARFAQLRQWGYSAVELPVADFVSFDATLARRAAADAGLILTLSAKLPDDLRLTSEDANVRRRTREWIASALDRSAECGAYLLAGPLHEPIGYQCSTPRTAPDWDRAVECLQLIGGMLDGVNARLAIEPVNRYESRFLNTAQQARALCDAAGSAKIGVCFNTFHANIEEPSLDAAIETIGARLFHVHLAENTRGIAGAGQLNFAAVTSALARRNYRGVAVVEGLAGVAGDDFATRSAATLLPLTSA